MSNRIPLVWYPVIIAILAAHSLRLKVSLDDLILYFTFYLYITFIRVKHFGTFQGYQRRQRRSEEELKQASDMVARGMTFQVASEKYKIPISTIRFYMVRKGILQRRKRGRGSSNLGMNSQPSSPASPPYHMMNYRLPESLNSSLP